MATIGAVIGYKSGLTGVPLILTGGIFGGVMAVLMPAPAQPVVRRIIGSDDVALGALLYYRLSGAGCGR